MRYPFSRCQRLTKKSEFEALYSTGLKRTVGPLLIHRKPNALSHSRLGLSVPRRVGNAVQRNKLKRLCREAFRLLNSSLPKHMDILITVRPHTPMDVHSYVEMIEEGVSP